MSWVVKHNPKKTQEIAGQDRGVLRLIEFINLFPKKKKAALLYGPAGIGKTASVYAIAAEKDFELVQVNASDFRNKAQIDNAIKPATRQASLFGTKKIVLLDEIDGLSGNSDRGGIAAIIEIIKNTQFPIILTANDPWKPKMSTLRRYCEMIEFVQIPSTDLLLQLKKVCRKEGIKAEEVALKRIVASANGDLRAAINDLQMLSNGKTELKNEDIMHWNREQEENVFNTMKLIFKSFDPSIALSAMNDLPIETRDFTYWLDENMHVEYRYPAEKSMAYTAISDADIFEARIRRRQHWRFLLYVKTFLSAGVQQAKSRVQSGFSRYNKPETKQKMFIRAAKRKKAQGLANQISKKLHSSSAALQKDFLPYFEFIKKKNKKMGEKLDEFLET